MVDTGFSDDSNGVEIDPFPKDHLFWIVVRLHFTFHFQVEDLKGLAS